MATSSQIRRAYGGPFLFSHGFRVFFLAAGLWALVAMLLWGAVLAAGAQIPGRLAALAWHQHEMVFGYFEAVLAGFLLTAVPNWTGRMPVVGAPVAALAALWFLARVCALGSGFVPLWLAGAGMLAFPAVLAAVIGREVVAGGNTRNFMVVAGLAAILGGEVLFLGEALLGWEAQGVGLRLGVAAMIWFITLIGGRVVPSFSRNWMVRAGESRLPAPPGRLDQVALALGTGALLVWVAMPQSGATAGLAVIAAGLHLVRLWRWRGWRARREALVWILHAAYLFVPVGFLMLAAGYAGLGAAGPGAVPHGWSSGAVLLMTLAMMTRASLGHSGRMLTAAPLTRALYGSALATALVRILGEFTGNPQGLLVFAAVLWCATFLLFLWGFVPILTRPRVAAGDSGGVAV